ncbi:MAG TPA: hypothetical protein VMN03_07415, partial [Burkholderiales bacterium]|nr:hypothetical protein [Burkholderiales bacterium]
RFHGAGMSVSGILFGSMQLVEPFVGGSQQALPFGEPCTALVLELRLVPRKLRLSVPESILKCRAFRSEPRELSRGIVAARLKLAQPLLPLGKLAVQGLPLGVPESLFLGQCSAEPGQAFAAASGPARLGIPGAARCRDDLELEAGDCEKIANSQRCVTERTTIELRVRRPAADACSASPAQDQAVDGLEVGSVQPQRTIRGRADGALQSGQLQHATVVFTAADLQSQISTRVSKQASLVFSHRYTPSDHSDPFGLFA